MGAPCFDEVYNVVFFWFAFGQLYPGRIFDILEISAQIKKIRDDAGSSEDRSRSIK